jgi:apolipoprotein N-acyltransferase
MGQSNTQFRCIGVPFRTAVYAAGVAVLGALSFPPFGLWPLSVVSVCLFVLLLRDLNTATARNLGLLYGFLYGLGTMYWFFGIFGVTAIALIAIFAAYYGILGTLVALTRGHAPLVRAALVALFAVGIEWLRGDAWYLRFPWYTVPHALAQEPARIAPVRWLGTYGFSFLIWLIAAWGAFSHKGIWLAYLLVPLGAVLLPAVPDAEQKVLLVQTENLEDAARLIHSLPPSATAGPQLAVLPEYAYPSAGFALTCPDGPTSLAHKCRCPVVFGAREDVPGSDRFDNVAVVIDEEGEILDKFPKQRPVPLFRDGRPGTRRPVIPVKGGVLGVAVCYDFDSPEIAATLVNQGATVLVAPTFDALRWGRVQHVHHELLARLRAVENNRWLLRCASSGRSEVINPHGIPSHLGVEVGGTGTAVVEFGHIEGVSPGSRLYFLGPAAMAGTALYLVVFLAGRLWRRLRIRPHPTETQRAPRPPDRHPPSEHALARPDPRPPARLLRRNRRRHEDRPAPLGSSTPIDKPFGTSRMYCQRVLPADQEPAEDQRHAQVDTARLSRRRGHRWNSHVRAGRTRRGPGRLADVQP